jgi:hypothetical protein
MLLWASERELYGRARDLRRRSMRGQTCRRSSRAPARRVMFDDNVCSDGQVDRCDSSCSELEYACGSRRSESKRLRRDVWSEPQHAHATIEEDHVDGEAHANRVNAAAGNQQQPLLMVNCFLSAPADTSCDERVRDAHLARHTAPVDGLKCDCLHDFFPECALLVGAARVEDAGLGIPSTLRAWPTDHSFSRGLCSREYLRFVARNAAEPGSEAVTQPLPGERRLWS